MVDDRSEREAEVSRTHAVLRQGTEPGATALNLSFSPHTAKTVQLALKRGSDFLFALGAVLSLSVLMLALMALIHLTGGKRALAGIPTIGRNGVFYRLRFCPLAPQTGAANRAVAIFIERSGLGGLPQLLNVLAGDMALVGPRPRNAQEGVLAVPAAMRPGLLVWTDDEGAYDRRFSLWGDVGLIAQTLRVRGYWRERVRAEKGAGFFGSTARPNKD